MFQILPSDTHWMNWASRTNCIESVLPPSKPWCNCSFYMLNHAVFIPTFEQVVIEIHLVQMVSNRKSDLNNLAINKSNIFGQWFILSYFNQIVSVHLIGQCVGSSVAMNTRCDLFVSIYIVCSWPMYRLSEEKMYQIIDLLKMEHHNNFIFSGTINATFI